MENQQCVKRILSPQDFMVKLDLKDAYLTVSVHPDSQKVQLARLELPV